MNTEQFWDQVLSQLKLQMTQGTFETWVQGTELISEENGLYRVGVKGEFAKDWLENRLFNTVQRTVSQLAQSEDIELEFINLNEVPAAEPSPNGRPTDVPIRVRDRRRGKRYFIDREFVFDGFAAVVGPFGVAVYNVLSAHADNTGQDSHMYYSTIATLSGMSRRKVIYVIPILEEHRLVEVDREGKGANDFYLLDVTEWKL